MIDSQRLVRWYDVQAPFYRLWRNDYDQPVVQSVVAALGEGGARRALLDAGCGTGLFTIALAGTFPEASIDGLDASSGMLRVARREARRRGARAPSFVQGSLLRLPYADARFDGAVLAGVLPALDDKSGALGELRRVLAPGGRLVVVEFDRETMRAGTRAFVRMLIAGYRVVSFVLRRYRFASGWNLERSTLDRDALESELLRAAFRIVRVESTHEHLVLVLERG
jgi:ubiquinone/menaquinone biosynthesis C-methylase UbiE